MLRLTLQLVDLLVTLISPRNVGDTCTALKTTLSLENTTILNAERIAAGTNISTPGSCPQSTALSTVDVCRVYAVVNTTEESAVHFEVWLPDIWYGRFLAGGNGNLGGCESISVEYFLGRDLIIA
jgi:feruloyl esterase